MLKFRDQIHNDEIIRKKGRRKDNLDQILPFLDELYAQYQDSKWQESDPVEFVHQYKNIEDQECVGWICSLFAYGSVRVMKRALSIILKPLGPNPAKKIREYNEENLWPGFKYRFHTEEHVIFLILYLSKKLKMYKNLGQFYKEIFLKNQSSIEKMLEVVQADILNELNLHPENDKIKRGIRFLFNSPKTKSACKRHCMFLRWMSRKDSIDIGLWQSWLPTEILKMPLDTHTMRISFYIGLRSGREQDSPNWKFVEEVTNNLKLLNPRDPIAYDFSISRLGILNLCKKKYEYSICSKCPLKSVCRFTKQ